MRTQLAVSRVKRHDQPLCFVEQRQRDIISQICKHVTTDPAANPRTIQREKLRWQADASIVADGEIIFLGSGTTQDIHALAIWPAIRLDEGYARFWDERRQHPWQSTRKAVSRFPVPPIGRLDN